MTQYNYTLVSGDSDRIEAPGLSDRVPGHEIRRHNWRERWAFSVSRIIREFVSARRQTSFDAVKSLVLIIIGSLGLFNGTLNKCESDYV